MIQQGYGWANWSCLHMWEFPCRGYFWKESGETRVHSGESGEPLTRLKQRCVVAAAIGHVGRWSPATNRGSTRGTLGTAGCGMTAQRGEEVY